jgi:hypothetical protein
MVVLDKIDKLRNPHGHRVDRRLWQNNPDRLIVA